MKNYRIIISLFIVMIWIAPSIVSGKVIRVSQDLAQVREFYIDETGVSRHVPDEFSTIQAAINASAWGDTVLVGDGTYTGQGNKNLSFFGKELYLMSENGPDKCIIDCEHSGRGINFVSWEPETSLIQGFTVTNGGDQEITKGGAMQFLSSSASIRNCIITGNEGVYGGGIYCESRSLNLTNCSIEGNTASNDGGGIFFYGIAMTLDNCVIEGNSSFDDGGGFYCDDDKTILTRCKIKSNHAVDRGGGLYSTPYASIIMDDCVIQFNSSGSLGGGVGNIRQSSHISNCIFLENMCYGVGGGVYLNGGTLTNCFLFQNTANTGGGIYLHYDSYPNLIDNCTVGWNTAFNNGGGVFCEYDSDTKITNCILWGDSPNEILDGGGGIVDVTYCDILHGWEGVGNINEDPLFVAGPLGDFYLSHIAAGQSEDSPCIDAGSDLSENICFSVPDGEICMNELTTRTDLITDMAIVDMGYHYPPIQATPTPSPTSTPPSTLTPTPTLPYTHTPIPSNTPTPEISLGVKLDMPGFVHPNENFWITGELWNYEQPMIDVPVCFLLQVGSDLWFWPSWSYGEFDYKRYDVPVSMTTVEVIPLFTWPDTGTQSMTNLWIFGAMLNESMTDILGEWDSVQWGFSP